MNRNLMKVLQFSILGMSAELRAMQERMILLEKFGNDAVTFPNMHNPLRNLDKLDEMKQRHDELVVLIKRTQEAVDAISDGLLKEEINKFFGN